MNAVMRLQYTANEEGNGVPKMRLAWLSVGCLRLAATCVQAVASINEIQPAGWLFPCAATLLSPAVLQ